MSRARLRYARRGDIRKQLYVSLAVLCVELLVVCGIMLVR